MFNNVGIAGVGGSTEVAVDGFDATMGVLYRGVPPGMKHLPSRICDADLSQNR